MYMPPNLKVITPMVSQLTLCRLPLHPGAVPRVDQLGIIVVIVSAALTATTGFSGAAKTSADILCVDYIVQVGVARHGEGAVGDLHATVKHRNLERVCIT